MRAFTAGVRDCRRTVASSLIAPPSSSTREWRLLACIIPRHSLFVLPVASTSPLARRFSSEGAFQRWAAILHGDADDSDVHTAANASISNSSISTISLRNILAKQANKKRVDQFLHCLELAVFDAYPDGIEREGDIDRSLLLRTALRSFIRQQEAHSREVADGSSTALRAPPLPLRLVWNATQRSRLKELLRVKGNRTLSSYVTRVNIGLRKKYLSYPIGEEASHLIDQLLLSNQYKYPRFLEFEALRRETRLSDVQLRFQLKSRIQAHFGSKKALTADIKNYLREYLREKDYQLPSPEERAHLLQKLNISKYQLNYYIHYLKEYKRPITAKAVEIVKVWIDNHPPGAKPTKAERLNLCKVAMISSTQLSTLLIAHEKKGDVTKEKRKLLEEWLERHGRRPSTEERRELREALQWSTAQINRYIRVYFDSQDSGKITKSVRKKIQDWLQMNQHPTVDQKKEMQQKLGISRAQLNGIVSTLRKRESSDAPQSSSISEEGKTFLSEWLKENGYKLPNEEQKAELCNRLKVGKSVLGKALRSELSKFPLHLTRK